MHFFNTQRGVFPQNKTENSVDCMVADCFCKYKLLALYLKHRKQKFILMKKLFIPILAIGLMVLTGCSKEKSGSVVFYINEITATELLFLGYNNYSVYVEGNLAGTKSSAIYSVGMPDCESVNFITYTVSWTGKEDSKRVPFEIRFSNYSEFGQLTVQDGECLRLRID